MWAGWQVMTGEKQNGIMVLQKIGVVGTRWQVVVELAKAAHVWYIF